MSNFQKLNKSPPSRKKLRYNSNSNNSNNNNNRNMNNNNNNNSNNNNRNMNNNNSYNNNNNYTNNSNNSNNNRKTSKHKTQKTNTTSANKNSKKSSHTHKKTQKMKKMKLSGLRGTYKTFLKNANNKNKNDVIMIQNRPHKNLKGDLGVVLTKTRVPIYPLPNHKSDLNKELDLQRFFADYNIAPNVNSNYASFNNSLLAPNNSNNENSNDEYEKTVRKAYYTEKLTPIPVYYRHTFLKIKSNAKKRAQIMGIVQSYMEIVDVLVDELGYINLDMKPDNIVVYDKTPEIEKVEDKQFGVKLIDIDPDFYARIIEGYTIKDCKYIEKLRTYMKFVSLLQLVFYPSDIFSIPSYAHIIELMPRRTFENEMRLDLRKYVMDFIKVNKLDSLTMETIINDINKKTSKEKEFSLAYMFNYYIFKRALEPLNKVPIYKKEKDGKQTLLDEGGKLFFFMIELLKHYNMNTNQLTLNVEVPPQISKAFKKAFH